ncbi:MAG: hypothetical protein F6K28_14065 [Microcoleus sp. SIO2G3]|nr:hypothetical protein [Microcoleus sp. SIO2G3]
MASTPQTATTLLPPQEINQLAPLDIIALMIDLKRQVAELEAHIQTLKPAFFAACLALNTEKIALEQAIVSRRLTPGQWTYSPEIVQQEDLLKQSKYQFQQAHEPISGREVIWVIKLLLATA